MRIRLINHFDDLCSIEQDWIQLEQEENNKNISCSYSFIYHWWSNFGQNSAILKNRRQLAVFCLYSAGNKLLAVAPFCIIHRSFKKHFAFKSLEFIGQQWACTYADILGNLKEDELEFLWCSIKKQAKFDIVYLRYIPEFTNHFKIHNSFMLAFAACPIVKNPDYDAISSTYSKNLRQNIRTAHNRLQKDKCEFRVTVESKLTPELYEQIKRVSQSKLEDQKHSHYLDPEKEKFLSNYYTDNDLNIICLWINNNLAAYRLNILYNNRKFCLDASFDRQYKRYELESLSVDANLKHSSETHVMEHCMGTGLDDYKLKFTKEVVRLYSYISPGNTYLSPLLFPRRLELEKERAKSFRIELESKIAVSNPT